MPPIAPTPASALRKPAALLRGLGPWLAVGVLALGWGISYLVWSQSRALARQEAQAYFDFRVRDATMRLLQRLGTYEQVLRGTRGLFEASQQVSRSEFAAYAASLRLQEHHPGIQGLGYAVRLPGAQREAHESALRREGFPDYRIHPAGARDPLTAIVFLEPFAGRNLRAFGYDMFSEPVRREAMTRAWLGGRLALSGAVTLVQETGETGEAVQAGFLAYLPVYRNGAPRETEADRRQALVGWVYAPFRMGDFMAGVLGERGADLDIEVHEEDGGPGLRMYDRTPEAPSPRNLRTTLPVAFGGRRWLLTFRALPGLEAHVRKEPSPLLLVLGWVASLAPALAVWGLALSRDRALALARSGRLQVEAERLHGEEVVGLLAKGLAHDFNNLLQSILAWADLARLRAEPGGPVAEALMQLDEGSARARDLAERLRTLGGGAEAFDAEGPLDQLLVGAVGTALAGSEVEVRYALEGTGAVLRFHAAHLHQVFAHLAANAQEAMGGRGVLEVSSRREALDGSDLTLPPGEVLHLTFRDQGPGIPPELLPRIFDPYMSTKQTYNQKGLGLGLALCRIIVRQHGGAIRAESEPGRGAALHLYLPLARPFSGARPEPIS